MLSSALRGTHAACLKYIVQTGNGEKLETEMKECGEIDLTYALLKEQVFESFQDAVLDTEDLLFVDVQYLANNLFALADLVASNKAPIGGAHKSTASVGQLAAAYLRGARAETDHSMPHLVMRPKLYEARSVKDREMYSLTVENGKPATFQTGIFCGPEYLDSGNGCLEGMGSRRNRMGRTCRGYREKALCPVSEDRGRRQKTCRLAGSVYI